MAMGSQGNPFEFSSLSEPIEGRSPSLRAEIITLLKPTFRDDLVSVCPDSITVRSHTDYSSYVEDVSGNVAVAFLAASTPDPVLEKLVTRTVSESPHIRIGFVAEDSGELLQCDVTHDESLVLPKEDSELESFIKRLYVRAYYSTTVQRYYKICFSIQNRRLSPDKGESNERYQQLLRTRKILESYLQQFRSILTSEDLQAIKNREEPLQTYAERAKNDPNPAMHGLSEKCPHCDLDWTIWHDPKLRNGYERIGADTWRCTSCGSVFADNDPDNYQVG